MTTSKRASIRIDYEDVNHQQYSKVSLRNRNKTTGKLYHLFPVFQISRRIWLIKRAKRIKKVTLHPLLPR